MQNRGLSNFLQSHAFMTLVRVLPWVVSYYLIRLLTAVYFLAGGQERRLIRNNIEEVFERNCSRKEIDLLFRRTLKGIFNHYFEKLFLACSDNHRWKSYFLERIRLPEKKLLEEVLARKEGLILVSCHFGAVEFLPGFLTLLGYSVAIVAKFKTERLRKKCEEKAKSVSATIIDANEKNSFFRAISALREGKILITQCDEVACWKADPTRSINLFNTAFQVDRTVAILHKRSRAPVLFGYIRRDSPGSYTVEIDDLGGTDGFTFESLEERILKEFEGLVYTYPDQWYIWKDFQRMKKPGRPQITIEDRKRQNLYITPAPAASYQPSHG